VDTIVALASGVGRSGVAVIRVSGPMVRFVLETISGSFPPPRQARLSSLRGRDGVVLDRGLVIYFAGPQSFTGEDVCEFHTHGSPAVIRGLLSTVVGIGGGIRLAGPGEFTRRAFANGKMDLAEVEALGALIDSDTERQRQAAMASLTSGLSSSVRLWAGKVLSVLALLEAQIDFSDEGDVALQAMPEFHDELAQLQREMTRILSQARGSQRLRDGISVVIAGPTNAGKSSLLNALVGRDAAIVSSIAGTTRDLIEAVIDIDGWPVRLIDTAGLREAGDAIEVEGVRRAQAAVDAADLVLWLGAADDAPGGESIRVRSKSDLPETIRESGSIVVSAVTGHGLDVLRAAIADRAERLCGHVDVLVTDRQGVELHAALGALERARSALAEEIAAVELQAVLNALERVVGRIGVEAVLDEIFLKFCIGK
jgi:tRNA modification GTPase